MSRARAGTPLTVGEMLGYAGGLALAPFVSAVARARRARMFHPDGVVYETHVIDVSLQPDTHSLAKRLAGSAIARLSSAWWRGGKEWTDALGLALRFPGIESGKDPEAGFGQQDLLFATIRFPWTTPVAPLTTNVASFLWNHYYAVSPFDIEGIGRAKIRLRSPRLSNRDGVSRSDHLARAAAAGQAVFTLEIRRLYRSVFRRTWEPVVSLVLQEPLSIDQAALRFSPFRDGRGIQPRGFVHFLRIGAYAASQDARPRSESEI